MNKYEKRNFKKARKIINWSFIGVISPVLGIVLAAIGKSILRDIPEQEEDDEDKISRVNGRGNLGIFISIFFLLVSLAASSYAGFAIAKAYKNDIKTAKAQGKTQAEQEASANSSWSNQTMLNSCLDSVDTWFDINRQQTTTIYQEQNLLTTKQQKIDECQARYPR